MKLTDSFIKNTSMNISGMTFDTTCATNLSGT